jgi:RNA polymerase sigma factor (sigma-70 family)
MSAILEGIPDNEAMWQELLYFLYAYARRLIHATHVESWQGQKADLVEDIVQETVLRILERTRHTGCRALPPIHSLKGFTTIVARHYCIDLQRHDSRLRRITQHTAEPAEQTNLFALVTERLSQEELFTRLVHHVAHFPRKQREALLIDLAKHLHFAEASALQKAFLAQGIDLRTYQRPLPDDPLERTRHIALVSVAYKRVARCMRNEDRD